MLMSEAIDGINKKYVPGVVEFYQKVSPNPWQMAHDRFESYLVTNAPEVEKKQATTDFHDECVKLIEAFQIMRPSGDKTKTNTPVTAFMMADADRQAAIDSVMNNRCAECGTEKNVTMKIRQQKKPAILCTNCV